MTIQELKQAIEFTVSDSKDGRQIIILARLRVYHERRIIRKQVTDYLGPLTLDETIKEQMRREICDKLLGETIELLRAAFDCVDTGLLPYDLEKRIKEILKPN